ncbi:MAG TPA: FG-GAP repeat protein [Micromonosporaceae bacterium]
MKPVLRAATVAMTLAVSYGMIASSPATADGRNPTRSSVAVTDNPVKANEARKLNTLPYRDPSRRQRSSAARASAQATMPATGTTTTGRPAATEDSRTSQPAATTAAAKPYDIDGDGDADAVVGAVGEDLGYDTEAGMLHVLKGSSGGVTTSGDKVIHQDTYGVPGSAEDFDWFAWTNTSGDFNADGYADIAVSAIGEDIGSTWDTGLVQVFYGSATGLRSSGVTGLEVPRFDLFLGVGLAAGDFNGDGRDDLAVGGPGNDNAAGSVFVYPGTATGLSTTYQEFIQGGDVPGSSADLEYFGEALAAGDINGDGHDDLAIGAAGDSDDLGWPIGSVTLLYGHTSGLNANHDAQRFSKETPGVPGDGGSSADESFDDFGYDVTLADFNGDSKADLAVGAPGSAVTYNGVRKPDAGTVTVLYSNGTQIGTDNAIEITEATANIPGIPSDYDYLGEVVTSGDANGDGRSELAMFSLGDGYVTVIPGSATGLLPTSAKGWTQDSYGIPGVDESGDRWGNSLRFADIKKTGYQSLIVGADGENNFRGAFTVIHSTSSGLTGPGSQAFSQDTYGVEGTAEAGDGFGSFF